ncbi:hypothetical protein TNCV_3809071 [Trichonephila clavipes]|nr:hypothetical protein TNCV_3809071 [Trichonephila clavipes]
MEYKQIRTLKRTNYNEWLDMQMTGHTFKCHCVSSSLLMNFLCHFSTRELCPTSHTSRAGHTSITHSHPQPNAVSLKKGAGPLLQTVSSQGEQSNPAGAVDQGSIGFELLMEKPCRRRENRRRPNENPIGLTWEHDILVLKPSLCPYNWSQIYDWMGLDKSGAVSSNLKSETQTGAKILWI